MAARVASTLRPKTRLSGRAKYTVLEDAWRTGSGGERDRNEPRPRL